MTRHEHCQLFSITIMLRMGRIDEAIERLRAMRKVAAAQFRLEDKVNATLEQLAQGTADDDKQRPV